MITKSGGNAESLSVMDCHGCVKELGEEIVLLLVLSLSDIFWNFFIFILKLNFVMLSGVLHRRVQDLTLGI